MIPFIKGSKAAQFVGKQKGLIPIPLENLRTRPDPYYCACTVYAGYTPIRRRGLRVSEFYLYSLSTRESPGSRVPPRRGMVPCVRDACNGCVNAERRCRTPQAPGVSFKKSVSK